MGISRGIRRLGIRKKPSGWWITDAPVYYSEGKPYTEYGPYEKKADAQDDRDGLQRTFEEEGFEDEEEPTKNPVKKQAIKGKIKKTPITVSKQVRQVKKAPIEIEGGFLS